MRVGQVEAIETLLISFLMCSTIYLERCLEPALHDRMCKRAQALTKDVKHSNRRQQPNTNLSRLPAFPLVNPLVCSP